MTTKLLAILLLSASVALAYTDTELLASCIYLEAGGEGLRGMQAVACVIQNRANRDGQSFVEVITKPMQFSCFNKGIVIKYSERAYLVARQLELDGLNDFTNASYFYQRKELPVRKWHGRRTMTIGNHSFYQSKN